MSNQDRLKKASQHVRHLLQETFGHTLANCEGFLGSTYLVFYIRGFVSAMESVLVDEGEIDTVAASRGLVVRNLLTELKGVLQLQLGIRILEFYHDWNYRNNSGVIIALLEEEAEFSHPPGTWTGLDLFEQDVMRLSQIVQKVPEKTTIVPLTPRILLVQRDGILIMLEKTMIAKGYEKQLRAAKSELEDEYFHHNGLFEPIIGKELEDVFIDWNLREDRSLMCFVWK